MVLCYLIGPIQQNYSFENLGMKNIKHIVYLMLENRSLDQVLGWLYENINPKHVLPAGSSPVYNGLNTGNYYNTDAQGKIHYVQKISNSSQNQIPSVDPHEEYQHVNFQLYNTQSNPLPNSPAKMMGFYQDYADKNPDTNQIMQCYAPWGLPYLNGLAMAFAVSDAYYSSIPTQTNCNRGFAGSGNSIGTLQGQSTGMVNNHWGPDMWHPWDPVEFYGPTMWNVLSDNGFASKKDWMIFYSQLWPGHEVGDYCYTKDLFWPSISKYSNFAQIDQFYDMARVGTLPAFSYLEPAWFEEIDGVGWNGTDYHPPDNLAYGELFLVKLFNALQRSPCWENTLFIVNFDEHGGTYDHQPPAWGALPPWAYPADGTSKPDQTEYNFQFDRFGVRVPLILISPYINQGTVFRSNKSIPFDHCSVIATILQHFQIPKHKWQLGSRVANAPTFDFVLNRIVPRSDTVNFPEPNIPPGRDEDMVAGDLAQMIIYRMLVRALQKSYYPKENFSSLYKAHFQGAKTLKEMVAAAKIVLSELMG